MFVELLADIDMHTSPTEFYDRICEAICRLTTMRRAAIFMADGARRRVRAIGSYGIPFEQLSGIRPTLVNTPIAQRALLEDKVVVVSERIEEEVPPEYAQLLGVTTLVCTPLSAGGYAYGVICADRGGGRFELSDGERHLLWTLGKTAALVAAARNVTRQQERTRRLGERLDLAREIHESVLQRLFGVSLALGRRAAARPRGARALPDRDAGGAGRPAARARAAARAAAARDRHDARGRARPGQEVARRGRRGRLARRVDRARRRRAARAVGAGRGAAQHRQARRPLAGRGRGRRATRTRSCSRCATTAPGRAPGTRGWACGWPRSRRSSRAASSSPGRSTAIGGGCGWCVPLQREERVMDDRRLRVLVVDDHDVVHWGFRVLLGEQPWVERFFQARTGAEALALARAHKPHVALVDLFLAGESGAELCAAIREASPATRVLLISGAGRMSPAAARAAGASGFVSKDWEASRVAAAVRRVGLGMTTFPTKAEQPAPLLTEREREVLDLIAMRLDQPRDRRAALPVVRTRSRSTRARCTASCAPATGPRRCSGRSGSGCWGSDCRLGMDVSADTADAATCAAWASHRRRRHGRPPRDSPTDAARRRRPILPIPVTSTLAAPPER